ncbi:MAG: hypothetical protein KDD56_04500 [Bdellovibrionales bacterium]|nr:hypothetical protein [Bdellovibrionales bacterium]
MIVVNNDDKTTQIDPRAIDVYSTREPDLSAHQIRIEAVVNHRKQKLTVQPNDEQQTKDSGKDTSGSNIDPYSLPETPIAQLRTSLTRADLLIVAEIIKARRNSNSVN